MEKNRLLLCLAVFVLIIYISLHTETDRLRAMNGMLLYDYNRTVSKCMTIQAEHSTMQDNVVRCWDDFNRTRKRLESQLSQSVSPPFVASRDGSFVVRYNSIGKESAGFSFPAGAAETQLRMGDILRLKDKQAELGEGLIVSDLLYYTNVTHLEPLTGANSSETIREVWYLVEQLDLYSDFVPPRMPLETIVFGGGCQALAVLTASLLKASGPDWNISFFYFDSNSPARPLLLDHVVVHVDAGDWAGFIDPTSGIPPEQIEPARGFYLRLNESDI